MDGYSDETVDESPIGNLEPKPVLNFMQTDIAVSNKINQRRSQKKSQKQEKKIGKIKTNHKNMDATHYDCCADKVANETKSISTEEEHNGISYDHNANACRPMTDMNLVAPSMRKAESTKMPSSHSFPSSEHEDACEEKNEVSINSDQASNLNCTSMSFAAHEENKCNHSNPTLANKKPKKLTENEADSFQRITYDMTQKMKEARGVKRGRKVLDFTEYCNKTTKRIDELKVILIKTDATEEKRK